MRIRLLAVLLPLALAACPEKSKPAMPPPLPAPRPLEPLQPERGPATDAGADDREALFQVAPFTPHGKAAPANAVSLELLGDAVRVGEDGGTLSLLDAASAGKAVEALHGAPALLVPSEGTYLAQVTTLLSALDDAHAEVWLKHPTAPYAYRLGLKDEAAYQAWLDEPGPGRVRVIERADGYELTTALGKLLGGDPNGPTVPVRGGQLDLATLQKGLDKVKARFKEAQEVYLVPSYGTDLTALARTAAANWLKDDEVIFAQECWVYPRPVKEPAAKADAGK